MPKLNSDALAQEVLRLASENVSRGGGPFACLIVRDGQILARGVNQVTPLKDPTAHAEVQAIRAACQTVGDFELRDCELYTSCEPCPMCLGAIYWTRVKAVYYCATQVQAAQAGFDDRFIYEEAAKEMKDRRIPFKRLAVEASNEPFVTWSRSMAKVPY